MSASTDDYSEFPTDEQVEKYEMLSPMLASAIQEMREFSKKKQDGIVNKTKINILNRLLRDLKEVLAKEPSTAYLDLLDEEALPQNSDAVLILGQYQAAMGRFHKQYYRKGTFDRTGYWKTQEYMQQEGAEDDDDEEDDE